ncbi:MAG: ATP-binding protein [Selenomonadaceae bacterium]|nr:ATP-binding protein [Selenomonadaceae bacterium]MDD6120136.1 ATP-binding protein [Selenomonadaceae bacterium]MDY3916388.1 ATP-binding protein [Selenomonadaceae bacterium]
MMRIENERLEYKRELTEVVKKEVIAFANTLGGDIYIGIDDDGSVVGVAEPDD